MNRMFTNQSGMLPRVMELSGSAEGSIHDKNQDDHQLPYFNDPHNSSGVVNDFGNILNFEQS